MVKRAGHSYRCAVALHEFFSKRIQTVRKGPEYFGTVSNRAQESLAGVRVIRAYTQEQPEIESFKRVNREFVDRNLSLIRLSGVFHPILQFFIGLGFIAVLWYGGTLTIRGTISIGQFGLPLYLVTVWRYRARLGYKPLHRGMARWELTIYVDGAPIGTPLRPSLDIEVGSSSAVSLSTWQHDKAALGRHQTAHRARETFAFVGAVGSCNHRL